MSLLNDVHRGKLKPRLHLSQIGGLALAMLSAAQPPLLSTVLTTLISEVQSCSGEIILILDDYHLIEDRAIQEAMLFLLNHLPANLHLLLSCRVDPKLPLSRWRMRGQLLEICEAELRFTREEAASFLRQGMRLSLSEEEVALLEARTEGWIAGLQLAALSLRTQTNLRVAVQSFTGGQRFILDYVQEEILQRQPLPLQHFLLHIAILELSRAANETDFRPEMSACTVPTLVVHGEKDQGAPLELCGRRTAQAIPNSQLKVYEGAAHGLFLTHLAHFIESNTALLEVTYSSEQAQEGSSFYRCLEYQWPRGQVKQRLQDAAENGECRDDLDVEYMTDALLAPLQINLYLYQRHTLGLSMERIESGLRPSSHKRTVTNTNQYQGGLMVPIQATGL